MFKIENLSVTDLKDLGAVAVFASTGKDAPVLEGLCLEFDPGNRISAAATDRFSLGIVDIDIKEYETGGENTRVVVNAMEFAKAVKSVLPKGNPVINIGAIEVTETSWSVSWGYAKTSGSFIEGNYPQVRALIPTDRFDGAEHVNLSVRNYEKLVKFAKASSMGLDDVFRFKFVDNGRPVYVTTGDRFQGLLMPIRSFGGDQNPMPSAVAADTVPNHDAGEVDRLTAEIERLKADNAELMKLNKELTDRAVILEAEKIVDAVGVESVEDLSTTLEEMLTEVETLTVKMIDRVVVAVDRGDDVEAVIQYALGSTKGKRAEKVREILTQFVATA